MATATLTRKNVRSEGWLAKRVSRFLGYAVLISVGLFLFMPVFWVLVNSLKQDSEYMTYPIQLFAKTPQWTNYIKVFTLTNFTEVAFRTFLLGMAVAILGTFTSAMGGYAFARFQVPGNKRLFSIVIAMLIVPGIVLTIPQFILFARLKLTNTYWPWILGALGGNAFFIFFFRQFFLGFPKELEEAAEVDGCGPLRLFLQIFLPNAMPVIAVSMIGGFGGIWGDYLGPLLYLNDDKTLLGVRMAKAFVNPQGVEYKTISLAANVIYSLPLIIVFFFAQKYILKGVITSGLKG
jgi:ABC-type glycerol-3-phosphate transport system permease component